MVHRYDSTDGDPGVSRETVQRYDFTPIGKAVPTPQGYLKFDANLSRVGVLTYLQADGTKQRELRPPDEVFDAASLESLAGAPVTDLHGGMVNPANHCSLSRGSVGETVRHDARFVTGSVTVQDKGLIDKVASGERREGSPGYTCWLDRTPGDFNGERYDAIQRGIKYNHWALGPANWGRQGSDVALRLDGDDAASVDNPPPAAGSGKESETMTTQRIIKIDGIDYDLSTDAARQAIEQKIAKADGDVKTANGARGELQGKYDALVKDRDDLKTKLDAANDPARLDGLVNARADLVAKARTVVGDEEKLDGLTDRDIRVAVLKKLDEGYDDKGQDDAYIRGRFDVAVASHKPEVKTDGVAAGRRASPSPKPGEKTDGKGEEKVDKYDAVAAEARMRDRNRNAWKQGIN